MSRLSASLSASVTPANRSLLQRLVVAVFGDRYIPARWKLRCAVVAMTGLSWLLLASDPWIIFRLFAPDMSRVLHHGVSDKLHHFLGYLTLALCCIWYGVAQSRRTFLLVSGATLTHAIASESLQVLVPERTVDPGDFVANSAGVTAGIVVGLLARFVLHRSQTGDPPMSNPVPHRFPAARRAAASASPQTERAPAAPTVGFARQSLTSDEIAEIRPRMINYRFVAILAVTAGVFFSSVYAIHGWQMQRNAGSLIELGERARKEGDVGKARDYLNRYVGMVPNDANALATLGVLLDDSAEGPGAQRQVFSIYEDVLRSDPTREEIRRRQIETAMAIGRYSDALAHVKILRQIYSTDGDLALKAGLCQQELGDYTAAVESYEQAIEFSPRLIAAWSKLADLQHDALDETEAAQTLLDRLIELNSGSSAAWLVRARFRQKIGELDSAADDMQQALELADEDVDLLLAAADLGYARIAAARSRGQFPRAERLLFQTRDLLQRAIELAPERIDLRLQSILLESHFGDREQAMSLLAELLNQHPGDQRAHLLLADLTIERGEFDQAREALDLLPRTPASDAMRLFLDGRIALAQQQWRRALNLFSEARRFLADAPEMAERTDLAIATCHRELQDTAAEVATLRQIMKYNSKSVPGRLALARSLLRQQDLAGAIAEYRPVASLPQVRLLLARLLILRNLQLPDVAREWREAETLLSDAAEHGNDPTQVVLLQAELLAARGQFPAAQRLLKEARTSQADRLEFLVALSRLAEQAGDEHHAALWMGQALAAAGNMPQAEEKLQQALAAAPQDSAAARTLMELFMATDRRDDAVALFRKYAPRMNTTELAQTYALFGDHARAAELFQRESAQDATDLSALDGLTAVYLENDMLPQAVETLERLVRDADATTTVGQSARRRLALLLSGQNAHAARQRALQLLDDNAEALQQPAVADIRIRAAVLASSPQSDERAQAVTLLESLDDQNQLLPHDRWLLGRLYQSTGRVTEASRQLERSLEDGEVTERLLADYVAHLVEHGDRAAAEHGLTRLQSQFPNAVDALRLEARLAVRHGEPDRALTRLQAFVDAAADAPGKALRLTTAAAIVDAISVDAEPNADLTAAAHDFLLEAVRLDSRHTGQLVVWLLNNGRDVEAFEQLDNVWQQLPPADAAGLSMAMLSAGPTHVRAARVETQLTAALKRQPNELLVKVCLADVQSLQQRYSEAESLYRQVLHVDPQNLPALNNLAWLLAMQNRETDEALSLIERAMETAGPAPQLLDTRACALITQGRTRQALADLQTAIAEGEASATTLLHLAAAQLDDGNSAAAREALHQARAAGLNELLLHPLDRVLLHRVADALRVEQPPAGNDV